MVDQSVKRLNESGYIRQSFVPPLPGLAIMKIRPLLLLLLLLPLLGMRSCEKEPAPSFSLPPATQIGANTFGFVVGGRVWQNYGIRCTYFGCDTNKVHSNFSKYYRRFELEAALTARNVDEHFSILIDSIAGPGTYLSARNPAGAVYRAQRDMLLTNETTRQSYSTDRPGSGTFIITRLDTAKHIISGVFEGNLQNTTLGSNDSATITDGRFDIHYQ